MVELNTRAPDFERHTTRYSDAGMHLLSNRTPQDALSAKYKDFLAVIDSFEGSAWLMKPVPPGGGYGDDQLLTGQCGNNARVDSNNLFAIG